MRQKYIRSICSTCNYVSFCSLVKDKRNTTYCSEYEHFMDHAATQYDIKPLLKKERLVIR